MSHYYVECHAALQNVTSGHRMSRRSVKCHTTENVTRLQQDYVSKVCQCALRSSFRHLPSLLLVLQHRGPRMVRIYHRTLPRGSFLLHNSSSCLLILDSSWMLAASAATKDDNTTTLGHNIMSVSPSRCDTHDDKIMGVNMWGERTDNMTRAGG